MIIMNKQAFTLVELAIVMTIIGLLIGGILKGQELLENARVTSLISQVKSYQAGLSTFKDIHDDVMPGDMIDAQSKIPNCTATTACANGDGNGVIEIPGNYHDGTLNATITAENTQFWKHLVLSNLVSGISGSATSTGFGISHPQVKIGGGFFVRSVLSDMNSTEPGVWMKGHVLVLRANSNGLQNWLSPEADSAVIMPLRAAMIDRKMDDGMAWIGDVQSVSNHWNNGCGPAANTSNGPTGYNETITNKVCESVFQLY